ncbi:MAG: NAD(P)/FAD-dependent oxidoreductase [Candidatus Diapherotrites archaeon]
MGKKMKMVAVVGGGPVGLYLARRLQEEGWETVLLEEHSAIGKPVNCAGLISASGVNDLKLNIEDSLVNEIKGARIFSPHNEMLEVKRPRTVAYVIDRELFDKSLYKQAKEKGVEVRLNTKLIDVRNETLFVEAGTRGELLKAKYVVGADGVTSKMRNLMGIGTKPSNFVHAYQANIRGNFDKKFVEVYFRDYANDFFAWVIPESAEVARVGIATSQGNVKAAFDLFVSEKNFSGPFSSKSSALIPIGLPLKNLIKDNMFLVGDAAFQTKASTGGGVITGITAAEALCKTISGYLKDRKPFSSYYSHLKPLNKELNSHWKIHNFLSKMSEDKMDKTFRDIKNAGVEEFLNEYGDMDRPTQFLGKALTKPSLWKLAPLALRFL